MKRILLIGGGVLILGVLLAGAAYVAGRMWGVEASPEDALAGESPMLSSDGGAKGATVIAKIEKAGELPQRPPDSIGVFCRREDNRVFVSSSEQGILYTLEGEVMAEGDAKEVELVVTGETVLYEDVTQEALGDLPSGPTIEQKLEPGQVDEIGRNSVVMAWGEKHGERLVAEILVYTGPPVIVR